VVAHIKWLIFIYVVLMLVQLICMIYIRDVICDYAFYTNWIPGASIGQSLLPYVIF